MGALFNLQTHTSAAVRHVRYLGAGEDIGRDPAHQQLVSYDEQQGLPPYGSTALSDDSEPGTLKIL